MSLVVLTPMPSTAYIHPLPVSLPRVFAAVEPFHTCREVNINASRARLQEYFRKNLYRDYEFVLLMDSDVEIGQAALDVLLKAWRNGTTPCVNTKGVSPKESGHVVTSCALLSREDYMEVDFMRDPYECQCLKLPKPFYVEGVAGTEIKV